MDDYTPNEIAYLDLVNDISKIFCFVLFGFIIDFPIL